MWNDSGALQPMRSGRLLLGQWRATRAVRHRLGSRGQLLPGWHNNRIGHELPRRFTLHWRIRSRGGVYGCRRHILPCIECDERSSLPLGFLLRWRIG